MKSIKSDYLPMYTVKSSLKPFRGFHKWGYPQSSSIYRWIFPNHPAFLGIPHVWKPPDGQDTPMDAEAQEGPASLRNSFQQAELMGPIRTRGMWVPRRWGVP